MERLQIDSREEQLKIELDTVNQFNNPRFILERSKRLTASNFYEVIKRSSTPCNVLVKKILRTESTFTTPAMEYGKINESVAKKRFSELYNLQVRENGLFVDTEHGFLGATPDGLVDEDKIVEVKCLHSIYKAGLSLRDAVKVKKNICLEEVDGELKLKKTHAYYYQIQGQLHICKKEICYFIVYVGNATDLHVEEIKVDHDFWYRNMLDNLVKFYVDCIAPELILNRRTRGLKCRDPPLPD